MPRSSASTSGTRIAPPAAPALGKQPMIGPGEAVRLLVSLAAGSAVVENGEDDVDAADLTAALTLMPKVRAEVDELETSLLIIARSQGMTWQELAFWLGLGSAQAARQRYERLALRTAPDHAPPEANRGIRSRYRQRSRPVRRPATDVLATDGDVAEGIWATSSGVLGVAGWRGPLALNSPNGSVPVVTGRRLKTTRLSVGHGVRSAGCTCRSTQSGSPDRK